MRDDATYPVNAAAGLPETRLPDALIAQLPASVARAPWRARCRVLSWLHEVDETALHAVPEAVRPAGCSIVAWALVRYSDTPVGPYDEIAATLLSSEVDGCGHIPFIVVDSLPSIVGGRANWLLPKALARFSWSANESSATVSPVEPASPAWMIAVHVEPAGDPSPVSVPNHVQQASSDGFAGRFDGEMTGSLRPAKITVDGYAEGPLATLLKPGRYDGTAMTDCTFDVGPLRPA